jgi:DNA-binding PadR family transcriptional regulator
MSSSSALTGHNFYIVLALAQGPAHGLAIQKRIIGDTSGMYLRYSTLYSTLKRLERDGVIEVERQEKIRTYYCLTNKGKRWLENESRTLEFATRLAKQRLSVGYRQGW